MTLDNVIMTGKMRVEGKMIAITGKVPGIRRKVLERAIEASGGTFKKNVTKDTDLLVCGIQRVSVRHTDGYGLSRKERRAAELGTACVGWEEFLLNYDLGVAVQIKLFN